MEFLRAFFELESNRVVLNFAHGLIFFLLGFSVLLKTKRWSELTLAKALPYLAIFGVLNGMGDWGGVFLPIQKEVLSPAVIQFLWMFDTAILALSYAFLLYFGLYLLGQQRAIYQWFARLTMVAYVFWLGAYVWVSLANGGGLAASGGVPFGEAGPAEVGFEIAYRYGFAFLGSLVSAWALSRQRDELMRLGLTGSIKPLQWVGFSFLLHGIAAGLIVPWAPFFPANIMNDLVLFEKAAIPVRLFTGVSGLIVAIFLFISLEVFDVELARRLDEARQLYTVMRERTRIARDLHDGIIQTLYAVGLNLEGVHLSLKWRTPGEEMPDDASVYSDEHLTEEIEGIMQSLDRAVRDVRRYIMQLKVPTDELSLDEHLHVFIREVQRETRIPIRIKADVVDPRLIPADTTMDILMLVREAVSNASRHARASEIKIALVRDEKGISLSISDDGIGFDPEKTPRDRAEGHFGLDNMYRRAASIGGRLSIHSDVGYGTEVLLRIPIQPHIQNDLQNDLELL